MSDVKQRAIELLAAICEAGGNKAAAFTLRSVGAVGTVLQAQCAVLEAALSPEQRVRDAAIEECAKVADAMRLPVPPLDRHLTVDLETRAFNAGLEKAAKAIRALKQPGAA